MDNKAIDEINVISQRKNVTSIKNEFSFRPAPLYAWFPKVVRRNPFFVRHSSHTFDHFSHEISLFSFEMNIYRYTQDDKNDFSTVVHNIRLFVYFCDRYVDFSHYVVLFDEECMRIITNSCLIALLR